MPSPTGMAISIAMNEVTSVPYIGPSAPSTGGSADGAQRDVHRNGKPYCLDRGPGADDQGKDDAAEDQQDRNRAGARDPVEGDVAEFESVQRAGAIVRSGGFHYIALNGHVCHANPLYCFT